MDDLRPRSLPTCWIGIGVFWISHSQGSSVHLTARTSATSLSGAIAREFGASTFLASGDSPETTDLAGANGFRVADIRFTLARELRAMLVRPSRCAPIGNRICPSYRRSRQSVIVTHGSTMIPVSPTNDVMSSIKPGSNVPVMAMRIQSWSLNTVVNRRDMSPVIFNRTASGAIGLLAVADWSRGVGLGGQLVAGALLFFAEAGCKRVTVVTQGRNCPAQRLYQNCGFRSASMELWYHRWFDQVIS